MTEQQTTVEAIRVERDAVTIYGERFVTDAESIKAIRCALLRTVHGWKGLPISIHVDYPREYHHWKELPWTAEAFYFDGRCFVRFFVDGAKLADGTSLTNKEALAALVDWARACQ